MLTIELIKRKEEEGKCRYQEKLQVIEAQKST